MRISLKNRGRALLASGLVAAFFLLHIFVYQPFPPYSFDFPLLRSYTDAPAAVEKLSFYDEKRPTYFNPFRKITYFYSAPSALSGSDEIIIEQAESWFTSSMKPVQGNPIDYWQGEAGGEGLFLRPLVANEYANVLFFAVQYLIVIAFGVVILTPFPRRLGN